MQPPTPANDNTPMRLADAVKAAFPHGGMTVSGLRKEAAKGRLTIELIANKQFTTMADIEEMRRKCRVHANPQDCGSGPRPETVQRSGSSSTQESSTAQDAALTIVRGLKQRLAATSRGNASKTACPAQPQPMPST